MSLLLRLPKSTMCRKERKCDGCNMNIKVGDEYYKYDDMRFWFSMCIKCYNHRILEAMEILQEVIKMNKVEV